MHAPKLIVKFMSGTTPSDFLSKSLMMSTFCSLFIKYSPGEGVNIVQCRIARLCVWMKCF